MNYSIHFHPAFFQVDTSAKKDILIRGRRGGGVTWELPLQVHPPPLSN